MRKESICPFCFEKIKLHKVDFRCTSPPKQCPPENDDILAKFQGKSVEIKNKVVRLPPSTFMESIQSWLGKPQRKVRCHACREETAIRLCPKCHSELPYTTGEYQDLIFAIIGAKEAGKSHYISVLIEKIKNEVGAHFNCSLQPLNDETIKRYREDFFNPVFRKREVIQATRSARVDFRVRKPLIYTLSFRKKGFFKFKIREVVTIVFFDTAGEDLDAEDTLRTENKYIFNSSGIILLLDPLQLSKVRAELPPGTPLPSVNLETDDLVNRVAKLIRLAEGKKPTELISIPIAVAFSKIDALEPLLEGSSLNYPSQHEGHFDLNEFENVEGEMEARIREWSGDSLIKSLAYNFKYHAFFGLTALGCNPHATQKINKLRPRRVEEPFLWLLWKHKMISDEGLSSQFSVGLQSFLQFLMSLRLPFLTGTLAFSIILAVLLNLANQEETILEPKTCLEMTLVDFLAIQSFEQVRLISEQEQEQCQQRLAFLIDNAEMKELYEEDYLDSILEPELEDSFDSFLEQTQSTTHEFALVKIMSGAGVGLRYKPDYSRQNNVITSLKIGTIIYPLETIVEQGDLWYRIAPPNTQEGWVPEKYTMSLDLNNKSEAYIEIAKRKIDSMKVETFGTYVELCHFLEHVIHSEISEPEIVAELKLLYLLVLQKSLHKIPRYQKHETHYSQWITQQAAQIEYHNSTGTWNVKWSVFEQLYNEYSDLPIAERILQEARYLNQ
jgi:hypothetical protein